MWEKIRKHKKALLAAVAAAVITAGIYPPPPRADAALAVFDPAVLAQVKNQVTQARDMVRQGKEQLDKLDKLKGQIGDGVRMVKDVRNDPGAFAKGVAQCMVDFSLPDQPSVGSGISLCEITEYVQKGLVVGQGNPPARVKERRAQLVEKTATEAVALGAQQQMAVKQSEGDVTKLKEALSSSTSMTDIQGVQARILLLMLDELRAIRAMQAKQLEAAGAKVLDDQPTVTATPTRIQGLGSGK